MRCKQGSHPTEGLEYRLPAPLTQTEAGLTLIELLIVFVIIAIILALLFPTFGTVRSSVRNAHCVSNLHQISLAIGAYAEGASGRLPFTRAGFSQENLSYTHQADGEENNYRLSGLLVPYMNDKWSAFFCPASEGFKVMEPGGTQLGCPKPPHCQGMSYAAVYAWFYNGGRRNPEQYMKALNRSRVTCNDGEHNLADIIGTTVVADALGFHGGTSHSQEELGVCSSPGNGVNVLRLDGSVRRVHSNSYNGGD